jgi:hypothetical protein
MIFEVAGMRRRGEKRFLGLSRSGDKEKRPNFDR